MIRVLIAGYCLAHLFAFLLTKRSFFTAFRWYCMAAAVQGALSLYPWDSAMWERYVWSTVEPVMLAFRVVVVLELGYYSFTRLYPAERRHLMRLIAYCAAFGALSVLIVLRWKTEFQQYVSVRNALQTGLAMGVLTGIWYFWRRPQVGMLRTICHHAYFLGAYLTIKACVSLVRLENSDWRYWAINAAYLCGISFLIVAWGLRLHVVLNGPRARLGCLALPGNL